MRRRRRAVPAYPVNYKKQVVAACLDAPELSYAAIAKRFGCSAESARRWTVAVEGEQESEPEPASSPVRVVKPVRFLPAGIQEAERCANELGITWSQFVRDAVSEKVSRQRRARTVHRAVSQDRVAAVRTAASTSARVQNQDPWELRIDL